MRQRKLFMFHENFMRARELTRRLEALGAEGEKDGKIYQT
jgi:hypothetical protein